MAVNLYILALDSKGLLVDLEVLSKALNEISIKRNWNLSVQVTCPDIFEPASFRDNGSSHLRSSDEASEVYGRADRSNIARGG